MYNSQLVTERIKQVTKEKNVSMSQLNEICGLSKNAISSAGKSQEGMKAKNLYMIAEYLDVSVDYLLGRTDEPNEYNNISNIDTTVNGTQTNGNYNNIHIQTESKKAYSEMIEYLEDLSPSEKRHAVADLMDILEEKYPKKK